MTDNKIVKAFELCFAEKGTTQTCGKCPYHQFGELCKVERDRDAIDLIIRQQEEIDRLKTAFENSQKTSKYWHEKCGELVEEVQTAQSEAIKEFAESLNDRIINFPSAYPVENATLYFLNGSSHRQLEILEIIDNLVKEMVVE